MRKKYKGDMYHCAKVCWWQMEIHQSTSKEIEEREEFGGSKDVFENGLVLDYLRQNELALDVTP